MNETLLSKAGKRRKSLMPANKICLSCCYSQVATDRGKLRIFCQKEHKQATENCVDYFDNDTSHLLTAIKDKINQTQESYRKRFTQIHPNCFTCVQNCCTTPFLTHTPFYPEDVIYYMLSDRAVPKVPKELKHCMFFNNGCTLPINLRPHVCIEYKCIYQNDTEINHLATTINQATIYLLAITTRDYSGWRGEYTIEDRPILKEHGGVEGKTYDRFNREWEVKKPTKDLLELYLPKTLL